MISQVLQVRDFHKAFGLYIAEEECKIPSIRIISLRGSLIAEETKEVLAELREEDTSLVLKEICDLLYVTFGAIVEYGLTNVIEKAFDEVHRSNMSKLTASGEVLKREDGKVLKSDGYTPADVKAIVEDRRARNVIGGSGDKR